MAKNIGLSRRHKKLVQFTKFSKDLPPSGMFYVNSKSFYRIFCKSFGMGFESVQTNPDGREFDIFNPDIHANLIVFHFAIELLLKAFLSLKNGKLNKDNEGHRIKDLLLEVEKEYEEVREILQNQEYALLLEELGNNYTEMRYAGGTLFLRGNNKKGWKKKKPGEELAEVLHSIYSKLLAIFDEERIKPQKKGSEIALK